MTKYSWKVSDAAVNIEKYAMKIKVALTDGEAVVVSDNHRFVLISIPDYASS
ncbi:MAG: hypothetical protein WBZ48_03260 [Bacteroidota bacterium]